MKKVQVNQEKCIGCGLCVSTYDNNFDFDKETGLSSVISEKNVTDEMKELCPTGAIEVFEGCDNENCTCNPCKCDNCQCEDIKK